MHKYKVGDKVVIKKSNIEETYLFAGKTGVVIDVMGNPYPYLIDVEDEGTQIWCEVECLVEDKKVFTKKDLKTGMFGVMSVQGNFVIIGDSIIYQNGSFDKLSTMDDNLSFFNWHIEKVYEGVLSFNNLDAHIRGTATNTVSLVYDRERDTKKLYNGKVVCVDLCGHNSTLYTVGKIYEFVDGKLILDDGQTLPNWEKIYSFEDWERYTASKFIEIVE